MSGECPDPPNFDAGSCKVLCAAPPERVPSEIGGAACVVGGNVQELSRGDNGVDDGSFPGEPSGGRREQWAVCAELLCRPRGLRGQRACWAQLVRQQLG